MKQLTIILLVLLPMSLFGQVINRQELKRTNDLIRADMTVATNTVTTSVVAQINSSSNILWLLIQSGGPLTFMEVSNIVISMIDTNAGISLLQVTNVAGDVARRFLTDSNSYWIGSASGKGTNITFFGVTSNAGPVNVTQGLTNFSATLPIRSEVYSIGGTNLPVQIDNQIDTRFGPFMLSANLYSDSVTNASIVRQTQATALSNALVSLAYAIGANDTNYANGVTNASIVRQTQLTAMSNVLVALSYSLGADATNFTLLASNNVRLVAGLASTNLAAAILQAATNYANSVTNSSIFRQAQATALSNAVIAYAQPLDTDLTVIAGLGDPNADRILFWDDSAGQFAYLAPGANITITGTTISSVGGVASLTTNENQFGASVTITIKDGALVTNVVIFAQTNVGNVDMSKGFTNYSSTAPGHSVAGFTSGNGTEYGLEGFLDPSTGFLLWFSVTNAFATMTNRYVADHLPSPGDCWKVASTNGYEILWTNGPCVSTNGTPVNIITNLYTDNITVQKGGTFVGTQFVNITVVTNLYGSITAIVSNAPSFQLDFTPGVGTTHYQMTNMANNFTINLTNFYSDGYGPRDAWFYFETDSTGSRTVTVSTNGMTTGTRISWGFNSVTNGATAFTVTNRARLNLVRNRAGVVSAAYEFQQ